MSMQKLFTATAGAMLALVLPVSALADLTGTTTLSAISFFNLNAGDTPGCLGDLFWDGTSLSTYATSALYNVPGNGGSTEFDSLTLAILKTLSYEYFINIPNVAVNDVFVVLTNAGSYAKVLVTAINGTSITLQYDTYGVTAGAPVIVDVMNNYSYETVSPGSLFVIRGCGLASPASQAVLQDTTKGLPLTLNGASVSVTANGATAQPGLYYATATQIAAVLPSATAAGAATFAVAYNGQTTSSAPVNVSETGFGFDSFYGTGNGPAVATDANYELVTLTHSAVPGQAVIFWGSGLGAGPQDSDTVYTATPHGISVPGLPLQVLIGGIPAQILYQGRSGYPGLDQINVMVPQGVSAGCAVSVVAVNANYQLISNVMTLPIAIAGGACSDSLMAIGAEQVASLSAKSNVNLGTLVIQQSQGPFFDGAAQADFFTIPGSMLGEWLAGQYRGFSMGLSPQVSQGSCIGTAGFSSFSPPLFPTLDAGALTITVPSGTKALPELPGPPAEYVTTLGFNDGLQNPLIGGTYAFSGAGGKDVGAFTATLKFPIQESFTNLQGGPPSMQISASGQTITWTGGASGQFVTISGSSPYASFACNAPATTGQFTIPSYVLVPMGSAAGTLTVQVSAYPQSVSATGLDAAFLFGFVEPQTVNVTYY
jgi:uncharacterized protein (TIGR03437 family)